MKARVVRDEFPALNNKKESHMGNVTISHMNEPVGKTTIDKAYLFIESKCVIDRTIIDSNPDRPVVVPAMQIIGSHAKLFSVRLAAPGLYVVVSEGSCTLPTTVDTFRDLREVYILLRKFKDASVDLSNALIYSNRADDLKKEHLRDTWMPPRSGVRISPLPKYLLQSIGESSD
ncbi:uncharacterized protein BYT42DRAFT_340731 [Radiomyces spectabilis]|uniref:uncharacterized protein n=1 Tax=Radiomyces spectabilis TaxID=64574 RepID=UPI00221FD5C3|nr:uncharacterized protein BYT42DRAFT_340731 [Radiomyces spectabilis]KAI8379791.1 hypothetical protein BYT42DRAFT_340731 [Radiomyces spectabilis]